MDPQQRLALELSWEALEDAGIVPGTLRGDLVAVYVGVMADDYARLRLSAAAGEIDQYTQVGTQRALIANRISHFLGVGGESMAVDTGQSSSLVAVHMACESLLSGQSMMALAGGVHLNLIEESAVMAGKLGTLSADGSCYAFDARANGYVRGEGGGFVVLKKLSRAVADGDDVYAVIRGTAVNSGGSAGGLSAPSVPAQEAVLRAAYDRAGVDPRQVRYVELHGTGTKVGDPVEAQALGAVLGAGREEDRPLVVGSVKTNLGHLEGAAGIAGLLKTVLMMRHREIPASLNFQYPNPEIDFRGWGLRVPREAEPWPGRDGQLLAGVSSFGIGGSNCHVVLTSAPPDRGQADSGGRRDADPGVLGAGGAVAWALSGKSQEAVRAQAARLARHVAADESLRPADVGWSLVSTRAAFDHRLVVTGAGRDELLAGLAAAAAGQPGPAIASGTARGGPLAMLFTGQGAQRPGMARELHERSPAFAAALDAVLGELEPLLGGPGSLRAVMWGDDAALLDQTGWAQPALFAVEAALFELLAAAGVTPGYLLGHSIGEVTAAYAAGVWSLGDACRVVAARARLMQALPPGGAMAAIGLPEDAITGLLPGGVSVAAVNTADSVVISGPREAVDEAAAAAAARGHRVTRLRVSHAFHSALMDPMLAEFAAVLQTVEFRPPRITVVSDLTGQPATGEQLCSPGYWTRQAREPVRFADGVRWLDGHGVTALVELGPDGVLSGLARHSCAPGTAVVPVLRRPRDGGGPWPGDAATVMAALAQVHAHGVAVDWARVFAGSGARRVPLPTYAFQHQRYWPDIAPAVPQAAEDRAGERFWASVEQQDVQALARTLAVDSSVAASVLPALASWRARRRDEDIVAGWRYREEWRPLAGAGSPPAHGRWLVVVPDGLGRDAWAGSVAAALGAGALVLEHSGTDRAALAAALRDAAAPGDAGVPLAGVVSLAAALEPDTTAGLAAITALLQALHDTALAVPLWTVTRGAVPAGHQDAVTAPWQGGAWGLGRVAALELPDLWGGLVDLPGDPGPLDARTARWLAAAVSGTPGEDQVAVRSSGLFGRRLARARAAGSGTPSWATSGTALITGGTGGLGGYAARWLVERGSEHVVLASRRGTDAPGAAELAAELGQHGARVTIAACDVADRQALAAVLAGIPGDLPLRVVVHAAGVIGRGGPLLSMTPPQLEHPLRAKADGTRHLDELTAGMDLDAFVLFSSGAAAWGSAGQAGYAAGNACLDSLAWHRRARGQAATSLAWGAWDEAGILASAGTAERDQLERLGVVPMRPRLAIAALQRALDDDETALVVTDMDWARFAPAFTAARPSPLLSALPEVTRALQSPHHDTGNAAGREGLGQRLAGLPAAEREQALTELVRESAAAVLGHAPGTQVSTEEPFRELGFDSLTSVELRNLLQARTGVRLPATLVFDYPDPKSLANGLKAALLPLPESPNDRVSLIRKPRHDLFGELYIQAVENGQTALAQELMINGAQLRRKFHDPAQLEGKPLIVRISSEGNGPHVICVCPAVMTTGPQVYMRFAAEFADRGMTVSALVLPGFDVDDALPATRDALVRSLADSVEDYVGGSEFSLAGHSSGGAVAYELAKELQARGKAPGAVVLLDTFSYNLNGNEGRFDIQRFQSELDARLIKYVRLSGVGRLSERITAQMWTIGLLADWRPEGLSVPSLYIRPAQPLVEGGENELRSEVISMMTSVADVPGDHFTMLESGHVSLTARVVNDWLKNLS